MSDLTPQVGDVWGVAGSKNEYLVHRISDLRVVYSWVSSKGELLGNDFTIAYFMEGSKLIERDGKPYEYKREFEEGAFYPVNLRGPSEDIIIVFRYFADDDFLCHSEGVLDFKFSWGDLKPEDVGDKIEFKGLL